MPELIVIIIIIVLLIVIFIINTLKKEKNKISELNHFCNQLKELNYEIINRTETCYDLEVKNNNMTFLIKLITIPEFAEIQINNKTTWEIKYGAGNTIGKPQPYSKYLKNIASFMNLETTSNQIKVVVASPTPKKMVKYVNECEIEFVTHNTDVYGVKLISYKNLELFKLYQNKN